MFHWFGVITNTKGDSLPGWQVECVQLSDGSTVVPIYSDENETPILTASGISNRAKADTSGNYDFFVAEGTYSLRFYDANGVFQRMQRYLPMYGNAPEAAIAAMEDAQAAQAAAEVAQGLAEDAQAAAEAASELAQTTAGGTVYATWADLAAATGMTAGDSAVVFEDAGTHTDPVTSATVNNTGIYIYSASPAGWERVADTEAVKAADSADQAQAWAEGTLPGGAGTKSAKEHAEDSATSAATAEAARDVSIASSVQYPTAAAAVAGLADGAFGSYLDGSGNPIWGQRVGASMVALPGPWIAGTKIGDRTGVTAQRRIDRISGGQLSPLRAATYSTFTSSASSPVPVATLEGVLYGFHGANLYKQTAEGGAWSLVCAIPGAPVKIELMADGELVFITSSGIYKSSGWGASPTFTLKQANSGGNAIFRNWSSAGTDGVKIIVAEYATGVAGAGWGDSVKAWASDDSGDTWSVVYDASVLYPSDYTQTHIHGACYDPVQDIFLVVEGHSTSRGIYWTPANLGAISWTKITAGTLGNGVSGGGEPTNIVPTDNGILCASDGFYAGLWLIQRGAAPADMTVEPLLEWSVGRGGVAGFGECIAIDPDSGVVYIGFYTNYVDGRSYNPLCIFASNGAKSGIVWEGDASTVPASGQVNYFGSIVVTPWGTVEAVTNAISAVGVKKVVGHIANGGGVEMPDRGNASGGRLAFTGYQSRGLAVGGGAIVSVAGGAAMGSVALVSGSNGTAVGNLAQVTGSIGVAVGFDARAEGATSTVIGAQSRSGQNGVLIGPSRNMSGSENFVSIGAIQTVTAGLDNFVAVGHSVTVSGDLSVALGTFAQATAQGATAIGHSAQSAHLLGVALGRGSVTTADSQLKINARHVEMNTVPSSPSAPAAGGARFYTDVSGGKQRLMVRFPTGVAQQIAIEP